MKCVSAAAACPSSDVTHHHLLPYFYSNRGILSLYQNTDTELHKEIDDKLADRNKYFPLYELYDLPMADFKEDHWTQRLVCGIQEHCQKILIGKVFSSTTEGTGNSFQKFLAHGLDVSATTNNAFLFQGAPDVLIRTETAAVMMCSTDDSDAESDADSENGVIENCHQRPPLKTVVLGLPEKLGELVACQHTVLAAKILKRAIHRKRVVGHYEVKGLLVDKVVGAAQTTVSMNMTKGVLCKVEVAVEDYLHGLLSPSILCTHLHCTVKG